MRLTIRDTGKGISREFLPFVFEPFRQAENVTTRSHGGLGLGLAIVKQLVELHGGNLAAHSEGEGKGASFSIELPVRAVRFSGDVQASPQQDSSSSVDRVEGEDYPSLAGMRILIVDDQDDGRMLVRKVLERAGAEVGDANSVAEAVRHLERTDFDILLSDIAMPDADGYELLRYLRQSRTPNLPAVAMTAFGHQSDQQKIVAAGFSGYLKKPVEPIELVRELARFIVR